MTLAYASTVISAPVDTVWPYLRDFGALDAYYPVTEVLGVDRPGDQVGCVRTARNRDTGQVFRERLLSLSDADHTLSYTQLEFPAIADAVIVVRLFPVTVPGGTFIEWFCTFDVVEGAAAALIDFIVTQVYEPCFAGLQRLVDGAGDEVRSDLSGAPLWST